MDIISLGAALKAEKIAKTKGQYLITTEANKPDITKLFDGDKWLNTDTSREMVVTGGVYAEVPTAGTTTKKMYSEGEVDTALALKATQSTTYTKTESDSNVAAAVLGLASETYVNTAIKLGSDFYTGSYGLNWDETNDTYKRTGTGGYTAIQSLIRRCVLNADRSVNYYLDPLDSTKKADGTPSILTGADGNVMVEIPKFYRKYSYNTAVGVVHEHSISLTAQTGYILDPAFVIGGVEKDFRYFPAYKGTRSGGKLLSVSGTYPSVSFTIATGRTEAAANGTGWHQIDWLLYEALTLLCIIEYGTMNIQSALGQGRTALTGGAWVGGSLIGINGLSNNLGNKTGNYTYAGSADTASADLSFMSYRGCENFFGNIWGFIDGINIQERVPFVSQNPATFASDVFTGDYVSAGVTMGAANGYTRKLSNSSKGFFPTDVTGGTSAVGTTDYYYQAVGNRIAVVGGTSATGLGAGPLSLAVGSDSAVSTVAVGSGPSC